MLQVVEAVVAVAVEAELPVGEAVAVQLQALRLGAVARLPRTHARRLERAGVGIRVGGRAHRRSVTIAREGFIPMKPSINDVCSEGGLLKKQAHIQER